MDAAASGMQVVAGRDQLRERSDCVLATTLLRTVKSCGPDSLWVGVKSGGGEPAQPGAGKPYSSGDGDKQILIAGETTYKP